MLTVMFWNMGRKRAEAVCARLAHEHAATILAVTECDRSAALLTALNPSDRPPVYYVVPVRDGCRVQLFARFPAEELPVETEAVHYTIRRLDHPGAEELLFVAVHGRSKMRRTDAAQNGDLRALAKAIGEAEGRRGHTRTLVIGDLNADPFQEGMYAADGLHAVSSRRVAHGGARTVDGVVYPFFYNPMWRFLGDAGGLPPGTYYYRSAVRPCRFWHVFDQVLLRPALLEWFADDVSVLTVAGEQPLGRANQSPNPDVGSDHFPILVRLSYPGV